MTIFSSPSAVAVSQLVNDEIVLVDVDIICILSLLNNRIGLFLYLFLMLVQFVEVIYWIDLILDAIKVLINVN